MLELLAGPLFVTIGDGSVIDLLDIWETVDDKSAEKDGVRHLVPLNWQAHETGQRLQLRYLNEAVNVVVLEEEALQFLEALELGYVWRANDVVEADILEGDLLHGLLEVQIIQNLKCVAVNEKFVVTFDLSVTRLDEALGAGLLATLVAVQTESLDALHLVLPLLANYLE